MLQVEEFVQPVDVVPGCPQDDKVGAQRLRVVPGQPPGVQAALAQGGDEFRIVTIALGQRGAANEHNPRMTDVGPGKFHLILLFGSSLAQPTFGTWERMSAEHRCRSSEPTLGA